MSRRHLHLLLSASAWLAFNAITVWTMVFLADVVVPRTVDGSARTSTGWAITIDLALLGLFATQHSVMARRSVKRRLGQRMPAALERTTYVWATNLCLLLQVALWQPWGGEIWHVHGAAAVVLWVLCGAGWALAIASTFAVDHFELIGLRQAGWLRPRAAADDSLQVGGLHSFVRHPLMTGLLLAFWATPHMGASHLLFALASTGYIAIGIRFEERDLRRTFGRAYDEYASRVPSLVPGLRLARQLAHQETP
jgi:protein-S-isoprenylcysteine O-methyltransferase Ste14